MEVVDMKEVIRHYGGTMIAAVIAIVLIIVVTNMPLERVTGTGKALSQTGEYLEFQNYWRSR